MLKRVKLAEIAEINQWNDWDKIKREASENAGFIFANEDEAKIIGVGFNGTIQMSLENFNQHSVAWENGVILHGIHVSLKTDKYVRRGKFIVTQDEQQLTISRTVRLQFEFVCPDCQKSYFLPLAVKVFGRNSPFCKSCQKSVLHKCKSYKQKYEHAMMSTYGVRRPFQDKEILEKAQQTMISRYGKKFSIQCVESNEKRKCTMLSKYGYENYWFGMNAGVLPSSNVYLQTSKLEKDVVEELNSIFKDFSVSSYKTRRHRVSVDGKSYYLDFFVPGLNVAVEIYGDFWHANPSHFASDKVVYSTLRACDIQANDAARIEKIEQCLGTKIQIIWESAWKANKPLMLKRLQELIL
jgi:transposase-like protein/G:T-mismatch repair DNA endonuclease (very short patch repair protein)